MTDGVGLAGEIQRVLQAGKDPFTVLGLARGATATDVRARYKQLVVKLHPDKARSSGLDSHQAFSALQWAYEQLSGKNRQPLSGGVEIGVRNVWERFTTQVESRERAPKRPSQAPVAPVHSGKASWGPPEPGPERVVTGASLWSATREGVEAAARGGVAHARCAAHGPRPGDGEWRRDDGSKGGCRARAGEPAAACSGGVVERWGRPAASVFDAEVIDVGRGRRRCRATKPKGKGTRGAKRTRRGGEQGAGGDGEGEAAVSDVARAATGAGFAGASHRARASRPVAVVSDCEGLSEEDEGPSGQEDEGGRDSEDDIVSGRSTGEVDSGSQSTSSRVEGSTDAEGGWEEDPLGWERSWGADWGHTYGADDSWGTAWQERGERQQDASPGAATTSGRPGATGQESKAAPEPSAPCKGAGTLGVAQDGHGPRVAAGSEQERSVKNAFQLLRAMGASRGRGGARKSAKKGASRGSGRSVQARSIGQSRQGHGRRQADFVWNKQS